MVFVLRQEKAKNIALLTDVEQMRRQTKHRINAIRFCINDANLSQPRLRTSLINDLTEFQSKLQDLDEMLKVPFDVLVVVEKKE